MTRLQTLERNQIAREALNDVIRSALKAPAPVRWSVTARDDHSGDPAFYVYVEMPAENDIPGIATQNQLIADMIVALERIDDDRLPHVHFGPRADESVGEDDEFAIGSDADFA